MAAAIPKQVWDEFKTAFEKALDGAGEAKMLQAWKTLPQKTEFYERVLMPAIGDQLGLTFQIERLRCDYTFLDPDRVPLIAIESENCHPSAWQEMESLCSLAAPVKALILSCEWEDSQERKFLPRWTEIIRKHHAVVSMDCLYAIIVGEWSDKSSRVEYSFTAIEPSGNTLPKTFHWIGKTQ